MLGRIAETEVEVLALEFNELRTMWALSLGASPGARASMMKVLGTELSQRLTELALEAAGLYGAPYQPQHTSTGGPTSRRHASNQPQVGPDYALTAAPKYFNDRAGSIYAGSNEIQRNILSKTSLG